MISEFPSTFPTPDDTGDHPTDEEWDAMSGPVDRVLDTDDEGEPEDGAVL